MVRAPWPSPSADEREPDEEERGDFAADDTADVH
jgi:hypothetical protein